MYPVASFIKEVNPRLAKHPLNTNGCLANRGLTSLVKGATDVYTIGKRRVVNETRLQIQVACRDTGYWIETGSPLIWGRRHDRNYRLQKMKNRSDLSFDFDHRPLVSLFNNLHIKLHDTTKCCNPCKRRKMEKNMMTSSNGNIFQVTGPLCGEFTGPGEIPTQRPVTGSFEVFFDLRLNRRLSKQPWGWWFETPSWSL